MPMEDPVVDYARPHTADRSLWIAWLAEVSAFAGFVGLFFTFAGVAAIPEVWLAWVVAVSIVAGAVAAPLWLARVAVRRVATSSRADDAGRVMRSAGRARRSAIVLAVLGGLVLWAFPNRLESWRETREVSERARDLLAR